MLAGGAYLARRWGYAPGLGQPWLLAAAYPDRTRLTLAAAATAGLAVAGLAALLPRLGCPRPGDAKHQGRLPAGRAALAAVLHLLPVALPLVGGVWLSAVAPVYPLFSFGRWSARYEHLERLAPGVAAGRIVLFSTLAPLLAVTLTVTAVRLGRLRETGDTHGSSHWATPREVAATGLLGLPHRRRRGRSRGPRRSASGAPAAVGGADPRAAAVAGGDGKPAVVAAAARTIRSPGTPAAAGRGAEEAGAPLHSIRPATPPAVVVGAWYGRAPGEPRRRLHRLTDRRDRHVLAFAPSGSGKSTCLVIPTLLEWDSSAVVLDIKGELWHLTSGYRERALGQRCLRLDLAALDGAAARYNPLLLIPRGAGDVKHAQSVADVLVDPEGRDRPRTFWEQSAHALLSAVILHVVYGGEAGATAAGDRVGAAGAGGGGAWAGRPAELGAEAGWEPWMGGDEADEADGLAAAAGAAAGAGGRLEVERGAPPAPPLRLPQPADGERSLARCAHLLSDPRRPIQETLEAMLVTRHDPRLEQGWRDPHSGELTYTHPVVAAAARSLLDMDPRTSSGIVATAQAHLALFRDPVLAANTAASDFAPLDLVSGERAVSLYLTLAPADLDRLRGPIRLFLNQLCRALTERLDFEPESSRPARRHPLLLLLDEFPVLGKLDFFGRAMAYLRGYGIRVYLSIQSLAQLHEIYGQHQSITANCPVQVAFAPADLETAEMLSRMLGQTTVHLAKRSLNGAPLVLGPRRHTLSLQEVGRPLLTAEEVRRLPDGEAVVFVSGHAAIRGRRVPYFADGELAGRVAQAHKDSKP